VPTTFQPVIRNDKGTGERELVLMRWGLVPFLTKQLSDVDARLDAKTKQPYAFRLKDDEPIAFAGLRDAWKEPDVGWLQSYSIVTTEANELMSSVHTRMPVMLHPRDYSRWLDRDPDRPPIDLLRPFESELIAGGPCNPLVGNVKNNGPEMLNSA
jgi:putative SOS response-associated peptidase YedK